MQFLPKFKSKMGTKWEICFNFLGQFEFSDSLKIPDPILSLRNKIPDPIPAT